MTAEDLLIKEYFWLQSTIEDLGRQPLTIKGWSATVAFAALLALYAKGSFGRAAIWLAAFAPLPFWMTDALWKTYQRAYIAQAKEIETFFTAKGLSEEKLSNWKPLQISTNWGEKYGDNFWDKLFHFLDAFLLEPSVFFPHAPIILLGVLLATFYPPKPT